MAGAQRIGPARHLHSLELPGSAALEGVRPVVRLAGCLHSFSTNKSQREKTGDPRPSIGERYGGIDGYIAAAELAIAAQVSAGFLLPQERDRARFVMRNNWDRVSGLRIGSASSGRLTRR